MKLTISNSTVSIIKSRLTSRLDQWNRRRTTAFRVALSTESIPHPLTTHAQPSSSHHHSLNKDLQRSLSALIRAKQWSLESTIRAWRGEDIIDARPNKALGHDLLEPLLDGYKHQQLVLSTIHHGVQHDFRHPRPQPQKQAVNHKSAIRYANALRNSIRQGQNAGTYLVVDADIANQWGIKQFSPFGCVEKKDADPRFEARVIHDLSYPSGSSTNDYTQPQHLPHLTYTRVYALAHRIECLHARNPGASIKILKGDVKSAYRHVPVQASVAEWFTGTLPEENAIVVDLSLPFGWSGSPAHYSTFGGAISFLVRSESPYSLNPACADDEPFFAYEWVDDHILIEVDRDDRLELCESALRLAMLSVLGPHAINESKFSTWSTRLVALGLEWDTTARTVSMPDDKIHKAFQRVTAMLTRDFTTKHALAQLLGSLRHVCTCIPSARPFFQQLITLWRRASPYRPIRLSSGAASDLRWFQYTLRHGNLRYLPLELFGSLPEPTAHFYMDASDEGLCVLHPAQRQFIRLRFDHADRALINTKELSINVREQLSIALLLVVWGSTLSRGTRLTHIRCWIDNSSAVAWCNKRYSHNGTAQELNRVIGALEGRFGLHVSAAHLPGTSNTLADLGSRAWGGGKLRLWCNLTREWSEQVIPPPFRTLYKPESSIFNSDHSLTRLADATLQPGGSGDPTAATAASASGCQKMTRTSSPFVSSPSPYTCGTAATKVHLSDTRPCDPSSATLLDIIASTEAFDRASLPATNSLFKECDESPQSSNNNEHQSRQPYCTQCTPSSERRTPNTASSTGLRCWVSSFL